jgi:hypothetical protein
MTSKLIRIFLFSACSSSVSVLTLSAAPCANVTLAADIALGDTGCTIGGDTFFDFQLIASEGTGGATPIPAGAITVEGLGPAGTPGASAVAPFLPNDIGIDFNTVWAVTAGQTLDDYISFDVSVGTRAAEVTDAGIIQNSYTTGDGDVTVAEKGCSGITFPCIEEWGVATNNTNFVADTIFTATGTLSVAKDIAASAGSGTAGVSNVADLFSTSEVPEPRPVSLLLAVGFMAGAILRKRLQRTGVLS